MNDYIVDEIRQVREAIAARFDYDFDRIAAWGKERAQAWASDRHGPPKVFVDFSRPHPHPPSTTPTATEGILAAPQG